MTASGLRCVEPTALEAVGSGAAHALAALVPASFSGEPGAPGQGVIRAAYLGQSCGVDPAATPGKLN